MFRFPWGDMHSLNLGWFLQKFNELREDWATAEAGIDGALDAEIQRAEDALSDVFDARDAAAASATAAAGSATAAGTSATAAQNSATAAASSATLANNKATAAGLSEAAAAQSAAAAGNSATAAAGSATAASNAATNAAASETAAGNSATAAAGSASAAAGSASAAEASAQRAEDVEESIPEDYSTLSQDVSDLKAASYKHTSNLLDFGYLGNMWNQGAYDNPGQPYRCYTNHIARDATKERIYLSFNSEKYSEKYPTYTAGNVLLAYFDSNDTLLGTNSAALSFPGPNVYTIPVDTSYFIISISSTAYSNAIRVADLNEGIALAYVGYEYVAPNAIQANYTNYNEFNENETELIKNIIARRTNERIAPVAMYINDFILVGTTLFKAITNIQQGETLTPGTNVTATTIGNELTNLLN